MRIMLAYFHRHISAKFEQFLRFLRSFRLVLLLQINFIWDNQRSAFLFLRVNRLCRYVCVCACIWLHSYWHNSSHVKLIFKTEDKDLWVISFGNRLTDSLAFFHNCVCVCVYTLTYIYILIFQLKWYCVLVDYKGIMFRTEKYVYTSPRDFVR